MTQKIFTIRDSKGGFYHPPFYKFSVGEAERDLHRLTKDENSMIKQYPEDFDLYHVGEFDNITGKMTILAAPVHVIKAVNLISVPLN